MSKRVTRSSSMAEKEAAKIGQHLDSEKEEAAAMGKITTRKDLKNHLEFSDFTFFRPEDKSDVELKMIKFSGSIREQPDWTVKIQDKKQLSKLVKEFGVFNGHTLSADIVRSVVDKLTDYFAIKEEGSKIDLAAFDGTWQSDNIINSDLREELLTNTRILEESIPKNEKDWNDKNEQVWNLISPSMYPMVYKRSKMLKYLPPIQEDESRESLIQFHNEEDFLNPIDAAWFGFGHSGFGDVNKFSKRFQWLPSEFEIREDNSVRIVSYINNLHPQVHAGLYSVIEEVFREFIPLFEKVYTDMQKEKAKENAKRNARKKKLRNKTPSAEEFNFAGKTMHAIAEFLLDLQKQKEELKKKKDECDRPDEIPEFKLAGKTVQAITKLTNILLTPEKPTYSSGDFHIEGMLNEKIVATGIYYYDCDNITDARLEFQGRRRYYCQNIGSFAAKEGRCVAFPNYLHHRLTPFELKDQTRIGHMKMLAFLLVDPHPRRSRVVSTRHVPPQQKSWFVKEIMKGPICFPQEVVEVVVDKLDWPMGLKEAKRHRDQLLEEELTPHFHRKYCTD